MHKSFLGDVCLAFTESGKIHKEKIAQYLKEALEKYKGVTVSLTRDGDYDVSLTDRTQ